MYETSPFSEHLSIGCLEYIVNDCLFWILVQLQNFYCKEEATRVAWISELTRLEIEVDAAVQVQALLFEIDEELRIVEASVDRFPGWEKTALLKTEPAAQSLETLLTLVNNIVLL